MHRIALATLAVALLSPRAVLGTVLTLNDALERARREAPGVLAARLRSDEARGRLAGHPFFCAITLWSRPQAVGGSQIAASRRTSTRA